MRLSFSDEPREIAIPDNGIPLSAKSMLHFCCAGRLLLIKIKQKPQPVGWETVLMIFLNVENFYDFFPSFEKSQAPQNKKALHVPQHF